MAGVGHELKGFDTRHQVERGVGKREDRVGDDIRDAVWIPRYVKPDAACSYWKEILIRPRPAPHVEDVPHRRVERSEDLGEPRPKRVEMEIVGLRVGVGRRLDRRTASSASDEEITGPRDIVYIVALRPDVASPNQRRSWPQPTVALLPWGDIVFDFLGPLGLTLEDFAADFIGSWMFGYVEALKTAGVTTVVVCPTTAVRTPVRAVHEPTGAPLVFLPPPRAFAALRRLGLDGRLGERRDPISIGRAVAAHVAPYLATPTRRLARVLREERCDAILCQEYEHPRFDVAVAVGRRMKLPVFATFQGGDEQHSRVERFTRPVAMRSCAGLVVAPEVEAERVQRRYNVSPERIARVMNPVDMRVWSAGQRGRGRSALGLRNDALVVAWHGQVQILRKGLDVLLEAWRSLTDARPGADLHLVLAGSGEDMAELRDRVAAAALPGVRLPEAWVQTRSDLADLLAAADLYAFPSRHEGLPVAPLEALAAGVPVVASDARGVADAVGGAGVVVPVGDARALATALGDLLDDPARRLELARRARPHIEARFTLEAVGRTLRRFILPESLV